MKLASWEECLSTNCAYSRSPNPAKSRSLCDTALARIVFLKSNAITKDSARFIFEGYYSSALEFFHALVLLRGYAVENHVCMGYYVRDILKDEKLFRIFDDCRKKRNSVVYYGKDIGLDTAKESIKNLQFLMTKIEELIKN